MACTCKPIKLSQHMLCLSGIFVLHSQGKTLLAVDQCVALAIR